MAESGLKKWPTSGNTPGSGHVNYHLWPHLGIYCKADFSTYSPYEVPTVCSSQLEQYDHSNQVHPSALVRINRPDQVDGLVVYDLTLNGVLGSRGLQPSLDYSSGNLDGYSGYESMEWENSVSETVPFHHPHNAFLSLADDIGVPIDSVSKSLIGMKTLHVSCYGIVIPVVQYFCAQTGG